MIMSEVVLSQKTVSCLCAAVVLNSRPIGVRMLCSYVTLLSKGNGTDGELYLQDFLSHASLMTTALSLESLRLAAAASFCLHNTSVSACMPDITHMCLISCTMCALYMLQQLANSQISIRWLDCSSYVITSSASLQQGQKIQMLC